MGAPTRRILDPIFGAPVLRCANSGRAGWSDNPTYLQKGSSGYTANLYGGAQSDDDWAAIYIPVSEVAVTELKSALWTYYMTAAQTMGVNMVVWVHDPDDNDKRAEITQLANVAGLEKALGWDAHELNIATDQFFFYGEGTTGTGLTAGATNLYGWDDFQADAIFSTWTIYRISFEYGWEASGTFDNVWVADIKLNGQVILLKPSVEEQLSYQTIGVSSVNLTSKVSVGSSDTTVLAANPRRRFAVFVNDSDEVIYLNLSATAVMNQGIRLNVTGGSYEINATNLYTGEVSGICTSGTKNITVTEG